MSEITILSEQPPGGRCSLYMQHAETLREVPGDQPRVRYSGEGEAVPPPAIRIGTTPVAPSEGVIVSSEDIAGALADQLGEAERVRRSRPSSRHRGVGAAAAAAVDRLRLFAIAPSPGGVESLMTQPVTTTHHGLSPEKRARRGSSDGMIRLLVGIEDTEDLISDLTRARGALFHTDAAQSVGKIPVDVDALGVDLLTIAGHKLYGPKGVGALYLRAGTPIAPILHGAGHEQGLRPGTENVPHLVGLGAAAELARARLPGSSGRLRERRDALHRQLAARIPGLLLNGHPEERLPNTLHLSFPGVSGRALLARVPEVAASVGSACHEEDDAVSGVLAAMGVSRQRAQGAVRLSVGAPTTGDHVARAADDLAAAWKALTGGPAP